MNGRNLNSWKSPIAWILVVLAALFAAAVVVFPGKAHAETRVQIGITAPPAVIIYEHRRQQPRYPGVRSVPNYPYWEPRGVPYDAGGYRWEPTYRDRFQRNCYIYDSWRREYLPC